MKHILNDLTEEEKNSIREQHTGGMKVMTESFTKLINSKLGDVKPMVNEQRPLNKKLDPKKMEVEERLRQEVYKKYGCGKQSDTFDSLVEKYQKAVNDSYEKEMLKVDGILGPKTASQVCPA